MKIKIIACLVVLIAFIQLAQSSRAMTKNKWGFSWARKLVSKAVHFAKSAINKIKGPALMAYKVGKFVYANRNEIKGAGGACKGCYAKTKAVFAAIKGNRRRVFTTFNLGKAIQVAKTIVPAVKGCIACFKGAKALYGKWKSSH